MTTRNIIESFGEFGEYLKRYSIAPVLDGALMEDLKAVHKRVYALLCWQATLEKLVESECRIWLDEAVSEYLHCLLLVPQGFYKVTRLVHRSAVENVCRYMYRRMESEDPGTLNVTQMFENLLDAELVKDDSEMSQRIGRLHQVYKKLCLYVHTSGGPYCTLAEALDEFPTYRKDDCMKVTCEICSSLHAVNGCFVLLERKALSRMYPENKDAVLENLTPTERRIFV